MRISETIASFKSSKKPCSYTCAPDKQKLKPIQNQKLEGSGFVRMSHIPGTVNMPTVIPLLIPLANFLSTIFVTDPRLRPVFCNPQAFSHYCLHRGLKLHNKESQDRECQSRVHQVHLQTKYQCSD